MPKCTFCGNVIEKGTGKLYIYVSGKQAFFCSGKCEKNMLVLKRKPLKVKWTETYRKAHGKENKEEKVVAKVEEKVQLPKVEEKKEVPETKEAEAPKVEKKKEVPVEEKVEEKKETSKAEATETKETKKEE